MTRMERKQRRIEIAVNTLIGIGCVILLLAVAALLFEIDSTYETMRSAQQTLEYAQQVNAECEALLEEVAPWRN